jgi:hypothetical protein
MNKSFGTTHRPSRTTRPGRWATRPRKARRASNRILVSRKEVARVAETETPREDESTPEQDEPDESADLDWNENEPSPHQGEEGQEGEA